MTAIALKYPQASGFDCCVPSNAASKQLLICIAATVFSVFESLPNCAALHPIALILFVIKYHKCRVRQNSKPLLPARRAPIDFAIRACSAMNFRRCLPLVPSSVCFGCCVSLTMTSQIIPEALSGDAKSLLRCVLVAVTCKLPLAVEGERSRTIRFFSTLLVIYLALVVHEVVSDASAHEPSPEESIVRALKQLFDCLFISCSAHTLLASGCSSFEQYVFSFVRQQSLFSQHCFCRYATDYQPEKTVSGSFNLLFLIR